MVLVAASVLCYGILFLYLSVVAGRIRDREGNVTVRLSWIDQIPTEIYLLFCVLVMAGIYVMTLATEVGRYNASYVAQYREQVICALAVTGTVISSLLCALWYSFIRRCKREISGRAVCFSFYLIKW